MIDSISKLSLITCYQISDDINKLSGPLKCAKKPNKIVWNKCFHKSDIKIEIIGSRDGALKERTCQRALC